MESSVGVFADGEWESLSRLFSTEDQVEFTPHFLSQGSFPFQHNEGMGMGMGMSFESPSTVFYPNAPEEESFFHPHHQHDSSDALNSNVHYLSQESSNVHGNGNNNHGMFTAILNQENYYLDNSCHLPLTNDMYVDQDHDGKSFDSIIPDFNDTVMDGSVCNREGSGSDRLGVSDVSIPEKDLHLKRVVDVEQLGNNNDMSGMNPKKKPRISKDAQKSKKSNVRAKKGQKGNSDVKIKDEEESNGGSGGGGPDRQSSSSCSSEDDNGGETSEARASSSAPNLNGKTRANRGSATDPQSLYARKRRERINERLRILQNLVPNGTKVDISTMLEEAVHYVNFLQLQIKLLSSDDMWMYSPIAYNGMDIGLNLQKMNPHDL